MNPSSFLPFPLTLIRPVEQEKNQSNDPPARVQAALRFLDSLSSKISPKAAVNDMSIEWAEMPLLSKQEVATQDAACTMLQDYFSGRMLPDNFERMTNRAFEGRIGTFVRCFVCYPEQAKSTCILCKGTGQLLVFSTNEGH